MKRLSVPLLVTLLAVFMFVSLGVHSDDAPIAVPPNDGPVADGDHVARLANVVERGETMLLDLIREYGPEVSRHDFVLDRMIELRAMQAELQHELEAVNASVAQEQAEAERESAAVSDLENLRRQAVELAAQQVATLEEEVERAKVLAAEGVASMASVTDIVTQLQAARIQLVEQQIALAEIGLRTTGGELEGLQNAIAQHVSRIQHVEEQLTRLDALLEPSLQYRALDQKLERQREALATWDLQSLSPDPQ